MSRSNQLTRAQAELLYEIGKRISSDLNLDTVLSEIVSAIYDAFDYFGVMLMFSDKRRKNLVLRSIVGGYKDVFPHHMKIVYGEGMIGQAAITGEVQLSNDVSKESHYVQKVKEITKSELAVPIKRGDEVIGVLDIQSNEYNCFDETDVTAMKTLSTQIAVAIENARLYEQAQKEIAERKKAENALRIEKAYLEQLFDNSPEAIVMVDNEGGILRINKEFTKMFGYKIDEVFGTTIDTVVVPREFYDEAVLITSRVKQKHSDTFETVRQCKDGSLINVSIIGTPVIVGRKQVAVYGIYRDITKRVQAEERRAQLLAEIEHANQELKDFAYIVSHDLKAPLRGMGSLIDWLATDYGDKFDDDGRELLRLLSSRARRMNDLIDGILQYSRVGRIHEEKVEIDLNQLVGEVIESIVPPQHISVAIEGRLPTITGERTRMEQIFQNLIGNAVKYMDKPQGKVSVGCVSENGRLEFHVSDNGPGIEQKYFNKIFQIFQTLSPRDDVESTGIGLTLVKKIVEMYGGRIWIESEVGKGSTFKFVLPRKMY